MSLSGSQWQRLQGALVAAYPGRAQIAQLTQFYLNQNVSAIAGGDNLNATVFNLIQWTEARAKTDQLVSGARALNPDNPDLLSVALELGLAPTLPTGVNLERMVDPSKGFIDIHTWSKRLWEIERQVCEVAVGAGKGTGFLIANDVVMTNYHVIESLLTGVAEPKDVKIRFDYKRLLDGRTVQDGHSFDVVLDDWHIDSRPYSPLDSRPFSAEDTPKSDQVDYALLRVAGEPGSTKAHEHDPEPRGWMDIPDTQYSFDVGSFLMIVQHPERDPLKIALDDDAIIGVNDNRTRVRYRTNTEPGSSGSPCFNNRMELVALHHAGDPNYPTTHHADYNEGIPIDRVRAVIEERGLYAME